MVHDRRLRRLRRARDEVERDVALNDRGARDRGPADVGRPADADKKLVSSEWTTDRIGLPLLREALAWFECQVVGEHPAGDHLLVLGRVINGKLLDPQAEPMSYRQTGAMDGASALFPDVFDDS